MSRVTSRVGHLLAQPGSKFEGGADILLRSENNLRMPRGQLLSRP
jgi:hypothetical protein